jgi:tetratricopeptide (TPR) repeat protein
MTRKSRIVPDPSEGLSSAVGAAAAFRAGEFDQAERLGRRALAQNESDFDALHLLGAVEVERRRVERGLVYWDKARVLQPENVELLVNYGIALDRLQRDQDALTIYGRALALKPDYAEAITIAQLR